MSAPLEMWHEARERMRRERADRIALATAVLLAMVLAMVGLCVIGG